MAADRLTGRDYQETFARRTLPALWRAGRRAVLAVAPVGAGKTRAAGMVAWDRYHKGEADFWHLAHRRELITTPWRDFNAWGIPTKMVLAGDRPDPSSPVHVASADTLINCEITPCRKKCVVCVDEAHRVVGARYLALLDKFYQAYGRENVYLVLLTATPYRLDGRPLGHVADALVEMTDTVEMIDRGIIVDPLILGVDDPDLGGSDGEFHQERISDVMNQKKLVGNVVDEWIRLSGGVPSVFFASSIAHSEHITDRLKAVGIRAMHLDHNTPPAVRALTLARLSFGGRGSEHPMALDAIVNADLLREGWDGASDYKFVLEHPELWNGHSYPPEYVPLSLLSDAAPTSSTCVYIQRLGRVCRSHYLKVRALVLSHSGNWRRHPTLRNHRGFKLDVSMDFVCKPRALAGESAYVARQCPGCMAVWGPEVSQCSACGAALTVARELPEEDDSQLGVVDAEELMIGPPNPTGERVHLTGLWKTYFKNNETRQKQGKPPIDEKWVLGAFNREWRRWPSRDMVRACKRAARGE